MKSYQIIFEDLFQLTKRLELIRKEWSNVPHGDIYFNLSWANVAKEAVYSITYCINSVFPESEFYGNEASANIVNGKLAYGVVVNCYVMEEKSSKVKLLWVEEGSKYSDLADLWNYCRQQEGLRAVELTPSLSYVTKLKMDNSIPDIDENILIFGGATIHFSTSKFEAEVIAKGHSITENGMAALLYFGDKLNIFDDYVLGWKGLGRYMEVTKSNDKIISEIDGKPAFSVYEKYLGLKDGDDDNIVFPLIVEEDGIEYIRTPQKFLHDKSMRMFANIPEGSLTRIAYGDKNTILQSLFDKSLEIAEFEPQIMKAYSCTARKMFWGDKEAQKETLPLQEIAPISGFYTGGEILRLGNKLRVLNSTLVVISFREGEKKSNTPKNFDRFDKNDTSLISRITHFVEVVSKEQQEALNLANEEKKRNELQQLELQKALMMADSANRAKTEFLFNMSHDIRTPMNAILGFTGIAIKHVDDREKTLDCLYKTQQSGDLLLSLINNVLEVSRIEAGKAEIEELPVNVEYSFTDIESTMKIMADSKDIVLSFEFGTIEDKYIMCDINRCRRVFVNIISNAIKYTNEGGYVKIKCEQEGKSKDGYATFKYTFSDNGIGMSDEFQGHIFEQFSREKNVQIMGIQGSGLGMAVCKSYVELMGGEISCRSKLGEGTTITLRIPFKIQNEQVFIDPVTKELIDNNASSRPRQEKNFAGMKILLTEDNDLNREIATEILEEQGLIVDEASDGLKAVGMLKEKGPSYYAAILMDIQMPVMDGYEATRVIRKMYPDSRIPIIALSANAFEEDKSASRAVGMDDHIAKPIKNDILFSVLAKYV